MAITPQAIKDQEFQVKLRGYDTVEVKAYLELIAEEFFEILEQVRQQIDDLEVIVEERDTLQADKNRLQKELANIQDTSAEIQSESAERNSKFVALQQQIAKLKTDIARLEAQNSGRDQELADAQTRIKQKEAALEAEKERNDKLNRRLVDLEKQNEELRSEELSFKSTLVAAQQFTTELKRKSEKEARKVVDKARADAEQLRQATLAELASYPAEIERLKNLRNKVRDDLEEVLKLCLDNLATFKESKGEGDFGEVFRKMQLEGGASVTDPAVIDDDVDLDSLDVNFDLTNSEELRKRETFSFKEDGEGTGKDFT